MRKPSYKSCLAIIKMPKAFFESLMNHGTPLTQAIHGVRNMKILNSTYLEDPDQLVFLIHSEDVPAYVAYHKVQGDLVYTEIEDGNTGRALKMPQVVLEYISYIVTPVHKGNE